ncbi:outer membrane protein/protective antigen OMA87 [Halobacteroides halobius DSM 5150]|uniref:Outer membrane protein/protective antigen OMA87 n=1 Tax=Halobacteroides halobius (strain ATCC 35273 / DSM 5150 / MD-1) TaxID=748449 RepID=L0KAL0_HALHC|nr:BamA/TamA family outer membrane protein [Halobacteroides halobius]AGB42317.1 outer membrane protein/protective antigen OMA87 [Halobacteroides halobius DSM 5150]
MELNRLGIVTLVLILLTVNGGLAVAAKPVSVAPGDLSSNTITKIKVAGNDHISESMILNQIKTKVGDKVSYQQLKKDMQTIFDLGYFFDVRVNFKNHAEGIMLIFEVFEHPKLEAIKIKGNKKISDSKIKEILQIEPGEVLNINRLNKDIKEINKFYQEEGYVLAKVVDMTIKNNNELHLKINEGKLNKILITGNNVTKDYVIRRELSLQPGQVFNINQVWEDLRDIYNLGYFKDVKPKFNKVEGNRQAVNLEIHVKEAKTGTFSIGAGYSGTSGWTGLINIKKDNLFGRGQSVKLKWQFGSKKNTYEIGFYEPWAFGTKTSINLNLYNKRETRPSGTEEKTKGGSITVGRPLTENTKGYLKLNIDKKKVGTGSWQDNNSLTLKTVRDTRDNIFNPRTGSRVEFSVKKAGILGGDNDYAKYEIDARKYLPVGDDNSWAFRLKLGESSGDLGNNRYFLSGLDGVRGYNSNYYTSQTDYKPKEAGFIGDSIVVSNIEYRHKLVDKVTGVAFLDAGRTFKDNIELDKLTDLNYSVGLGVRFQTPIGQLGLDYGYAPDAQLKSKSDFSIRIGNRF